MSCLRIGLWLFITAAPVLSQNAQIREARERLEQGDTKTAIEHLLVAVQSNPNEADVQYWLGVAYYKDGNMVEALRYARNVFSMKPKHILNRNLLLDIYLKIENFAEAAKEADFLLREFPKEIDLRLKKASCLIGLNQLEEASIELSKLEIQKDVPANYKIKILLLLGEVYAKQKIDPTAISYYIKALTLNPLSTEAHLKLGKLYFKNRQYNDALKEYLEAVRLDSNNAEANLNVGYIYFNSGNSNPQHYGNAIYYLQKYTALKPGDPVGYLFIGKSYHALRSYRNAIPPLTQAAELDSTENRYEAIKLLAESYSIMNDYAAAIKIYEELQKKGIDLDAKDFVRMGLSYKALKDTARTGLYFDKAASMDPSYHFLYQEMGTMYLAAKNYTEAIRWYEKRIQASPHDSLTATAWQNLGLSQFYAAKTNQDTVHALLSLRNAIALKPYTLSHWLVFAQIAERADSLESAKTAYLTVLNFDTANAPGYFGLASVYYRLKQTDEAIRHFKKVLSVDDDHKYALYYLAQCYLRKKQNAEAIPYLKKYLAVDPGGSFALDSKKILKQLGVN